MRAPWVPAFIGSISDVLVLRETVAANGIPCLAPDVEHMDTATQGGNVFAVRLLVAPDRMEDALRVIPPSKRAGIPRAALPPGAGTQFCAGRVHEP
jgi:hypothetical protein